MEKTGKEGYKFDIEQAMANVEKAFSEGFKARAEAERIHLLMLEEQTKMRAETAKAQKETKFYLCAVIAGLLGAIIVKFLDKLF